MELELGCEIRSGLGGRMWREIRALTWVGIQGWVQIRIPDWVGMERGEGGLGEGFGYESQPGLRRGPEKRSASER